MPSIGGFKWPPMEVSPDRTAVLKPGAFRITDPLSEKKLKVYLVSPSAGSLEHSFRPSAPVYVPPGKYLTWDLDTPGQKIEFDVANGQMVEIQIERQ